MDEIFAEWMRRCLVVGLVFGVLAGCGREFPTEAPVDDTPPGEETPAPATPPQAEEGPSLMLDAAPVVAAGDVLILDYAARGEQLHLVTITFGDGSPKVVIAGEGQPEVTGMLNHAFNQAGQYTIVADVLDRQRRSTRGTLVVRVLTPSGS